MAHVDHPHHRAFISRLQNAAVPLREETAMPTHPDHTPPGQHPFESMGRSQKLFFLYTLPRNVHLELGFLFHPPKEKRLEGNWQSCLYIFSLSYQVKTEGPRSLMAQTDRQGK